jgi:predicted  nucleic acid-binding Zn-ribbon protein
MTKNTDLKQGLDRELAKLAQTRDELRVQIKLARADARDEWKRLEQTWQKVEGDVKRAVDHAKQPTKELGGAVRELMDELKRGYARIKTEIEAGSGARR